MYMHLIGIEDVNRAMMWLMCALRMLVEMNGMN